MGKGAEKNALLSENETRESKKGSRQWWLDGADTSFVVQVFHVFLCVD